MPNFSYLLEVYPLSFRKSYISASDFSGEFRLRWPTHAQTHAWVFGGVSRICGLIGDGTGLPAATMFGSISVVQASSPLGNIRFIFYDIT